MSEQGDLGKRILACLRRGWYSTQTGRQEAGEIASRPDIVTTIGAQAILAREAIETAAQDETHVLLLQRIPLIAESLAVVEDRASWSDLTRSSLALTVQFVNAVWADDGGAIDGITATIHALSPEDRQAWGIQALIVLQIVYLSIRNQQARRAVTTMEKL